MKLCFVIPFYNHPQKIAELVRILAEFKQQIFIIDDGSNEYSKSILHALNDTNVEIFTRAKNGGKGAAIKDGLNLAFAKGFTHAFQIDADMQHDLSNVAQFIALAKKNEKALICGQSAFENAPKARLYGRKITDFWVWLNTLGGEIKESMCGFRIYPLKEICSLLKRVKSNRMDFDIDILLVAYKKGVAFVWQEVRVCYEKNTVSHFKGFKDNLLISFMHARHFFALIPYAFEKKLRFKNAPKNSPKWFEKNEKAGKFWLRLSIHFVTFLPTFLVRFTCFFVSLFYYIISPKERKNIKEFYANLQEFEQNKGLNLSKASVFRNFYEFGISIADKIAVYKGKIGIKDLIIINQQLLFDELLHKKEGQIIITSHFGNIEIARVLSKALEEQRLCVLVYNQHAQHFSQMLNELSKTKIPSFCVDELDLAKMLELKNLLENGTHFGIMGDRSAIKGKNLRLNFLGKACFLPQGAFLLASLLKTDALMLWCERIKNGYEVEVQKLGYDKRLGKNEVVMQMAQKYIENLEKRVCKRPYLWFNFYDFWRTQ